MKPGTRAFSGAACEPRLIEWILSMGITGCKIVNRTDAYFGMLAPYMQLQGTKFVALGNEASKSLKQLMIRHFKLPHPSGRNRQVNNKKLIDKKLKECKKWLSK